LGISLSENVGDKIDLDNVGDKTPTLVFSWDVFPFSARSFWLSTGRHCMFARKVCRRQQGRTPRMSNGTIIDPVASV